MSSLARYTRVSSYKEHFLLLDIFFFVNPRLSALIMSSLTTVE